MPTRSTFDLETTNLDYGSALNPDNRVLMECLTVNDKMYHYGQLAVPSVDELSAFNAKFEMLWLKRGGYNIDVPTWHDPMLAEKVLRANKPGGYSLNDIATRRGLKAKDPVIDALMKAGVCPSEMPQRRLAARCARDVRTTEAILEQQLHELEVQDQRHLYEQRVEFCRFLAHVEYEGMMLDPERVEEEYRAHALELRELTVQLDEITGGINLRSPDQVAKFLYTDLGFPEKRGPGGPLRNKPSKQFPDGRPKTDKATMAWLAKQAKSQRQKAFIELRQKHSKVASALSKSLEFFKVVCDEREGKFHAQFNQTVAATDRLTSSGIPIIGKDGKKRSVQFQNMPGKFKRLFNAPEGYVIVECDAPQLEFRVGVGLGNDQQGIADILDPNFDAHCVSAAVMYEKDYTDFLQRYRDGDPAYIALRKNAKPHTFKPFYGGTKGTEAEMRWYQEFKRRYAGVAETQEAWVEEVALTGKLRMPWGKEFYWDCHYNSRGILVDDRTHRPIAPQIYNYPIQNLATAEIVPLALLALRRRCLALDLDVRFVNTIHDSIICYVKDDSRTRFKFALCAKAAFTTDVYNALKDKYGMDWNIPLGVGILVGKHWSEGPEELFDDAVNWRNDG